MYRKWAATAILFSVMVLPSSACLTMGANFWDLGWGAGALRYCTGGVWGNWSPTFISQLQIYGVLRWMDWNAPMSTITGPCTKCPLINLSWANRVKKSDGCTQCADGQRAIAYEWTIDITNRVPGATYWLNFPVMIDSAYVESCAVLFKKLLLPGHKIALEFGNETWWSPACAPWCDSVGRNIGLPLDQWGGPTLYNGIAQEAGFAGHAFGAARMWRWFRKAYNYAGGDTNNIIRILAGQAGYGGTGSPAHECLFLLSSMNDPHVNPSKQKCDWFATSSYFSCNNPTADGPGGIKDHYKYTQQFGVQLVTYEAGPSGVCDTAHTTQQLNFLSNYCTLYCQYTHLGGQWGAIDNGYYQALANWSKTHSACNPSATSISEPYHIAAPGTYSKSILYSLVNNTGIYGIDGRNVGSEGIKKTGCYIVSMPNAGNNIILNIK
jgi:hypothetical protein